MKEATTPVRHLAERLLELEASSKASTAGLPAIVPVCEKLRDNLASLMGTSGFAAVLARALVVAGSEVSFLRTVRVRADGSLEGLDDITSRLSVEQMDEGGAVLVARVLGLLVSFIGYDLTRQLLREVWPKLSGEDSRKQK